jgi:hypothetical protein
MDIKSEEHSRENSTLAPGNPSFDGFYRTVKMELFDKNHQKKGYLEQALSFLENVPHSLYPYRIFQWMIKHIQNGDGKYLPKVS